MLTSIALMFIVGMALGSIFNRLKLPSLIGMLLTGIILGPYVLNLIDGSVLSISSDLRQIALIIILTRAGLSLDLNDLKKVGRPAILLCFIPATFEILAMVFFAPKILGITVLEAAILGSVVAAVSPAVVVPRMIKLISEGYGTSKSIPQMIMAGASVDDVYVIVLFTSFISLATGGNVSIIEFVKIPVSIIVGVVVGMLVGYLCSIFFRKVHVRDTAKVIIILCISFLLLELENRIKAVVPMSGLLAIMSVGISIYRFYPILAKKLSGKYSKLWVAAEIMLFVLVGATVDISYAVSEGVNAVVILFIVLAFRMLGVFVCLLKTELNIKERIFCMFAYIPKATVQAAIGTIPLSLGLECGNIVLTVAVLAILITAPIGAFVVDITYKKWLIHND